MRVAVVQLLDAPRFASRALGLTGEVLVRERAMTARIQIAGELGVQ